MSYEINIISINQDKPVHPTFISNIQVHNELENDEIGRYSEIWPFFSSTKGIMYSLVVEINEGFYSSFPICDSDFNNTIPGMLAPIYVSNEMKENLTSFIVKNQFIDEFIKIIKFLMEKAPDKRLLFQTRYQGGDAELIIGVIKLSKFLTLLKSEKIFFNLCYIIEDD